MESVESLDAGKKEGPGARGGRDDVREGACAARQRAPRRTLLGLLDGAVAVAVAVPVLLGVRLAVGVPVRDGVPVGVAVLRRLLVLRKREKSRASLQPRAGHPRKTLSGARLCLLCAFRRPV